MPRALDRTRPQVPELPDPRRNHLPLFAKLRRELPQFADAKVWWPSVQGNETFVRLAQALLDGRRAAFDIDETILCRADCGYAMQEAGLHLGLYLPERVTQYEPEIALYEKALRGTGDERYQGELRWYLSNVTMHAGLSHGYVTEFSRHMWQRGIVGLYGGRALKEWVDPALAYLLACGEQGARRDRSKLGMAFISASMHWATQPLAEIFEIPRTHLRSMEARVDGGVITDQMTRIVYGREKVKQASTIWSEPLHFAFGNSLRSDGPMMALATEQGVGISEAMREVIAGDQTNQELVGGTIDLPVAQKTKRWVFLDTVPPPAAVAMPRLLDPPRVPAGYRQRL